MDFALVTATLALDVLYASRKPANAGMLVLLVSVGEPAVGRRR